MSEEFDLEAIKERISKASPGPWRWERAYQLGARHWALHNPEQPDGGAGDGLKRTIDYYLVTYTSQAVSVDGVPLNETPNFQFIEHAREDVPALVAEVERLRAEAEQAQVELRQVSEHCDAVIDDNLRLREEAHSHSTALARVAADVKRACEDIADKRVTLWSQEIDGRPNAFNIQQHACLSEAKVIKRDIDALDLSAIIAGAAEAGSEAGE